jgi:sterol desaturase/sphingolipid hydroxylase (fatty acid hydroxylase superfamily)
MFNPFYLEFGVKLYVINALRYVLIAGAAWLLFYVFKKTYFKRKRIQKTFPETGDVFREVRYSFLTFFIFSIVGMTIKVLKDRGYTLMYNEISDYGVPYFIVSILLMLLLHDTYFYWTHRMMHHKRLFPVFHRVHHLSNNPSPWAAFAFHPLEAVVEAGILPLIVFVIPSHVAAVLIFLFIMTVMNVIGHLGYELYPAGFLKHRWLRWNNTSTHHNMHHQLVKCNYGLYFNFWDSLMGTNHKNYEQRFEQAAKGENGTI